jgi:hypothetical protein
MLERGRGLARSRRGAPEAEEKEGRVSFAFFFSFFEIEQRGDGKVSSHFFLFLFRSSSSSA